MAGDRWFASDNNATIHPRIMDALVRANRGHAVGYGDDPDTARAEATVAAAFGAGATVRFVLNGTGANVYALGCFAGQGDAVMCSDCAHILVDETGAPTATLGVQLVPVETRDGKVQPRALVEALRDHDDVHKPRPALLSLSQPTEVGTVYSLDELAALCRLAHEAGMAVHIDGARLSNAAVALGTGPAEAAMFASDANGKGDRGADVVCFGGTKNGLMFGEAVVFAPRETGVAEGNAYPDTARLRKTRLQLASKMRFIAAQFEEYMSGDLWRECAKLANDSAARLAAGLEQRGITPVYPVQTNGVFLRLPSPVVEQMRQKRFFYDWEGGAVRWMASWDTSDDDVEGLLSDLDEALAGYAAAGGADADLPELLHEKETNIIAGRELLRSNWHTLDRYKSDEDRGLPPPPFTRPAPDGAAAVALPDPVATDLGGKSFRDITATRRSRRKYKPEPISLEELSFLLWSCAGVKTVRGVNAFRTVPSGGCRHPLDLLVYARRVEGLQPGLYRFMAVDRSLALVKPAAIVPGADPAKNGFLELDAEMDAGLAGQLWNCAAMFVWTAVPYRTEWRYTVAAAKTILLDAGHACQALYGACEAQGLGTCAQAAYNQEKLDRALGLDGTDEFAVYAAPVGRV
ncbi:MAG: SagB family peptide dehydrogenase [Spirochaetales bacterium]|nr:SagB family peptide dehydrogenase [Spirochaetales bacterium]